MSNQLANKKKILTNAWLYISIGATIVGGVGYWLLLTMTDTYDAARQSLDYVRAWGPLLMLALIIAIAVSVLAIVKTKAWYKLIPIMLVLVNAAIFALTFFAYALSA